MKKVYVKPALQVEYFDLTQSIASGCGAAPGGNSLEKPNHWDKSTCGWDMGNLVIWTEANSGYSLKWDADAPWEGVCYNNPEGGNSIFTS